MHASASGSQAQVEPGTQTIPRRPALWMPLLILASFWTFGFAVEWIEMSMSIRFISRWIAYGLMLLGFLTWWMLDPGIPRRVRWFALAAVAAGATIASFVADPTVAGFPLVMSGCPYLFTGWAVWIWLSQNRSPRVVRVGLCAVVALVFGFYDLVRWDGLDGGQHTRLSWRWTPTAEAQFLATRADSLPVTSTEARDVAPPVLTLSAGDWPQFRGPNRDSRVAGARIRTNWNEHPPTLVWRRRVGPGWSSMAIVGRCLFTQEQRGENEAVVCYDAASGGELWVHENRERFDEALSGPGPRATPSFSNGRIYTLGALGRLNCLDAATGQIVWTRNAAADAKAAPAQWGFSASPLVSDGMVAVFVGGEMERGLVAYRARGGEQAWTAATGKISHSSPQPSVPGDDPQVVMITEAGLVAVDAAHGSPRWHYPMHGGGLTLPIAQPQWIVEGSSLVIPSGSGIALVELASSGDGTIVHERWTSNHLKPSLNDFVVSDKTIYGFDDGIFCAVDLDSGKRRWKKGRYGHGQVLLFADQGLLAVSGENGEVILLAANPQRHEELVRFQAIEGKTWNHPAFARGRLYVRNAEEMACFDITADAAAPAGNTP